MTIQTETKTRMHLSLNARDLERSVDFYRRFFGTGPVKRRPDYAKFELESPGLVLSLNAARGLDHDTGQNLSHVGIVVPDDEQLRSEHARIKGAGIAIELEEEAVACCYAIQDKFWVRDPDGNAWEIYHFLEDIEQRDTVASESGACCGPDTACSETVC